MGNQWKTYVVVGGLLVLLFALLASGSRQVSLTADEPAYISCGYGLLARGREVFPILSQRGYPPLLIGMEASLIYLSNPIIPVEQLPGWPTDYALFLESFMTWLPSVPGGIMLARMPIIMLTVLLGAVVFRWAKDLWGETAGLVALAVLVFDPLLLGHGRLAHSDVGTVAIGTAALYATWRWAQKPSWRGTVGMGAFLGFTMLAKISGILWVAAAGLIGLATLIPRQQWGKRISLILQGAVAILLSMLILWAGYGFDWGPVQDLPISVPAPTHWENLLYLHKYADRFFALGQWNENGWWWYFPLAFLIKNPIPLLIGWVVGLVVLLRRPSSKQSLLAVGLFPILYTTVAIAEGLNIGYRHMLPIHPALYLTIAGGLRQLVFGKKGQSHWRWLFLGLGAWYMTSTLWFFPYEISYFNELVGGSEGGYRYLSGSNIDWGQTAGFRDTYLQSHPSTNNQPPTTEFRPNAGRYLVSASYLQGVGTGNPDEYAWFRHWEPESILEHSLLIYQVPPFEINWVAQCTEPATPLDTDSIIEGIGQVDFRDIRFNCTEAWTYPSGGATSGIYALHQELLAETRLCAPAFLPCPHSPQDPFVARHLAETRLSYEQQHDYLLPAFALYEMSSAPLRTPSSLNTTAYAISAAALPSAGQLPTASDGPIELSGPLAFLGAVAYEDEGIAEIETWWQVTSDPPPHPFSIMAHRVSLENGETLEIADGLGVSAAALSAGDVVVQRHRFVAPRTGASVWLLTGAYWRETTSRWTVVSAPGSDALLIQLTVTR